jgi:hypothetical protein
MAVTEFKELVNWQYYKNIKAKLKSFLNIMGFLESYFQHSALP